MRLSRRRDSHMLWPGFVDAVTTLLMVMIFVLTIFTVMQSVLRDTITTQSNQLDALNGQIGQLSSALGLERAKVSDLSGQLQTATAQVQNMGLTIASLQGERDQLTADKNALAAALAGARKEVDAQAEAARLAAARRDALEALVADLKTQKTAADAAASEAQIRLSDAEEGRLADAAAIAALQERLKSSDDALTAMTLNLEEQRKKAEETLTLLAAAQTKAAQQAAQTGDKSALLATAQAALAAEQQKSDDAAKKVALLNEQISALRAQLAGLQNILDASAAKDAEAKVQIEALGTQLNTALAQVASEQRRRAELEEAERKRLQAENQDLSRFRSEFFGQLSKVLAGRDGVRVVGDRFVFSSEVLFEPGAADLSPEGQAQIARVTETLREIQAEIPPTIDWIIRVDGHTDNLPITGGRYRDNWELSQARALSVVRYMQDNLGFPPNHLAATGFGEYQPVATGDTPEARAQNRRIELKLTER